MRITKLYIKEYKNLKDFSWEPNPESPVAVIVGKNASGKTNLLEAIMMIFMEIPHDDVVGFSNFEFELAYRYGDEILIEIERKGKHLTIKRNGKNILNQIHSASRKGQYYIKNIWPESIFLYYAGTSERFVYPLQKMDITPYRDIFDGKIRGGRIIINYEPIHYKAVMLAMLLSPLKDIQEFLARDFGIMGLVNFSMTIDYLKKKTENTPILIQNWIDRLRQYTDWERPQMLFFNAEKFGQEAIRDFDYEYGFFQMLDLLYVNSYLNDIDIFFTKEGAAKPISFNELSEGEIQRLAIRGAMEIFRGKETLFLLDEPDAFAHPRWQWEFIPDMNKAIGDKTNSQVIFATHSPIIPTTITANGFIMREGKISPMNSTFGLTVNESLAEQNIHYQEKAIADRLKRYFALIQGGKAQTEEALQIRADLEEALGKNHPEIRGADDLIALYE